MSQRKERVERIRALTFILPTRNRKAFVARALESCLKLSRPNFEVTVIVIDGLSTDGSWEMLSRTYATDSRVKLVRQNGPQGFMPACFLGLDAVQTEFSTFMYDDDVLSPHWAKLGAALNQSGSGFSMGFGKVNNADTVMSFDAPTQTFAFEGSELLRSFSQVGWSFHPHGLPFSPISCLTKTDHLRSWRQEVIEWTKNNPFREYWMIHRNAGPDLMIYLYSCLVEDGQIPVIDSVLAQWSAHPGSMTIQFKNNDIMLGYWLAKAWMCNKLLEMQRFELAGACAAGVIREGKRLLKSKATNENFGWYDQFSKEINELERTTRSTRAIGSLVSTRIFQSFPRFVKRLYMRRKVKKMLNDF